jgi:hypothetical protein
VLKNVQQCGVVVVRIGFLEKTAGKDQAFPNEQQAIFITFFKIS